MAAAQYRERRRGRAENSGCPAAAAARRGRGGEVASFGVAGADDQRCQPAKGRQPGLAPRRGLGFEKPVAAAGGERLHHRLVGHVGLISTRPLCPARPAGADLVHS